jgi:two-component system CheB/CheR fusion protein
MSMSKDAAAIGAPEDFLIVGIGGSAGAIGAFKEFFRHVPVDSGMAFIVILHLSPDHESKLAEVLQSDAAIPVTQVRSTEVLRPNHVYVIPPNKTLSVKDSTLTLSDVTGFEQRRAPVDILFRTLANAHDSRAVSVIMSGTGADGSMGLRRVKEYNGLVLVQSPAEAQFQEMPRNSIATGLVDFVLPVAEMATRIIAYRDQMRAMDIQLDLDKSDLDDEEKALLDVFTQMRLRTGHDFTNYKRGTVLRRIERRLAVREFTTLTQYAAYMREHPEEAHALLKELLISVTNFFRDREAFDALERTVIPKLFETKGAGDHVRVWVPGCATGEEAYSIAMLLAERAALSGLPPSVQVFASDLDEHAVAHARNAFYSEADVADVSPERLRRFFVTEQSGFRVRRELRELVLFAHHNLIKDPPFSHLDLVTCRNVLIYLNRTAQQRALETLHFSLEPGGYLFLGSAETTEGNGQLFATVDKEAHIYQSRAVPRVINVVPPTTSVLVARTDIRGPMSAVVEQRPSLEHRNKERFAPIDLHQRLLEEYAPPSVIVNEQHDVLHLTERAGRFMQFTGGDASLNLLRVIRPELRIELRTALYQAAQTGSLVRTRSMTVQTSGGAEVVDVIVRPVLHADDPARGFFLVLFERVRDAADVPPPPVSPDDPAARQLEEELVRVNAQMRNTIEHYETQAEEFKATNEELQAINEELRSTAEELETSQEELQSVNEELQTVNQELKVKIEEISHANNDMRNLMSSTEIGTIFVDRSLRVKLFTQRVRDIFNLIPADVGRPLRDISNSLIDADVFADVATVLERLLTVEREVETRDGRWHVMRLLPYRTSDDHIDGVVMTFFDITERRSAEAAVREHEERYRTLFNSIDEAFALGEMIVSADGVIDFRYIEVNPAFTVHTALTDVVGKTMRETTPAIKEEWLERYAHVAVNGEALRFDTYLPTTGRWFDLFVSRVGGVDSRRIAIVFSDITARKNAEEELRASEERQRLAIEAGNLFTWAIDRATRRATFSGNVEEVAGRSLPAAHDERMAQVHPDDRDGLQANFDAAFRGERAFDCEYRMVDGGEVVWLHSHGQLIDQRLVGVTLNVTKQKHAALNVAFLAAINEQLAQLRGADDILRAGAEKIAHHFDVPRVRFVDVDGGAGTATVIHEVVDGASSAPGETFALRDAYPEPLRSELASGAAVGIEDVRTDARTRGAIAADGVVSSAFAPCLSEGQWVFALSAHDDRPRPWSDDEVALLQEVATRIWLRLQRAHGDEALQRSRDELEERVQERTAELARANSSFSAARDEAERERERLRRILAEVPVGILVNRGPDHVVELANPAYTRLVGGRSLDGLTLIEAFADREYAATRAVLDRVYETGETVRISEARFRVDRDGDGVLQEGVFNSTFAPIRDRKGAVIGVVGVVVEVTELVRQREHIEALRAQATETTDMLQALIDASPLAIVTLDRGHNVSTWSASAERLFGWRATEVLGRPLPNVPSEERARFEESLRQAFSGATATPSESVRMRKDGTRIEVGIMPAELRDADGHVYASMAMIEDVTQRNAMQRERERLVAAIGSERERLREIFAQSPTLVAVLKGPDHVFEFANDVYLRAVNKTADAVIGKPLREAVPELARQSWFTKHEQVYGTGATGYEAEAVLTLKRGGAEEETYWNFAIQALRDREGNVDTLVVHGVEVTEQVVARRRIEALLDDKARLLQRIVAAQEEERQRIARELHDEMGQHITALKVGLESIAESEATVARLKAIVRQLDQSVDRLTRELRPLALDDVGLHGAVGTLVEEFSLSSGVRVDLHMTGDDTARLPDAVENTLYRVLQEALTNVWKHAHAKEVSVIVERRDGQVQIIIEDNGQGFDTDESRSDRRGRFGLLGIRERVALVGGSVNIESEPGSGTAIYIRVPLARENV